MNKARCMHCGYASTQAFLFTAGHPYCANRAACLQRSADKMEKK